LSEKGDRKIFNYFMEGKKSAKKLYDFNVKKKIKYREAMTPALACSSGTPPGPWQS
jgi:hypothetical protein